MLQPIARQTETLRDRTVVAIRDAIFDGTLAPARSWWNASFVNG
ncbi:hypothetical protein [Xanthobacter dioxanivorans]|nr:hypothetical protein [Xanthobacter dioxanivorans]